MRLPSVKFCRWPGRWPVIALLAVLLPVLAACSGEEDLSAGLDFETFLAEVEEDGAPVAEVEPGPYSRLDVSHERLVRISYVHGIQTLVREVTASSRDVERLVEDVAAGDSASLDWVVQVHDMHRASEELRIRSYGHELAEVLVLDYVDFHASFLEGVQVFAQASDRLLQAAIVLGPSGRKATDLPPEQLAEFRTLVGEAAFFARDTEVLLTRSAEDLQSLIQELHLR